MSEFLLPTLVDTFNFAYGFFDLIRTPAVPHCDEAQNAAEAVTINFNVALLAGEEAHDSR